MLSWFGAAASQAAPNCPRHVVLSFKPCTNLLSTSLFEREKKGTEGANPFSLNELHADALAVGSEGRRLCRGQLLHAREVGPRRGRAEAAQGPASSSGHVRDLNKWYRKSQERCMRMKTKKVFDFKKLLASFSSTHLHQLHTTLQHMHACTFKSGC